MPRIGGGGFSEQQVMDVRARWRAGESLTAICAALEKAKGAVYAVVVRDGGIRRPPRRRARGALSATEREVISRGMVSETSIRALARTLGRAPSTISREIQRNAGRVEYRAASADAQAWRRALRPKRCVLAQRPALRDVVAVKLAAYWSPRQITGWLVMTYPDDPTMRISHETLYKSLYIQARGVLKKQLIAHLRRQHRTRRRQNAPELSRHPMRIPDLVSIRERPAEVEDRAVPGHWEGDLLAGARNSHIATLVERKSRYVHLVHVDGKKDTASVVNALIREAPRIPGQLMKSLTWDRGNEMAQHKRFTIATDVAVYFCDPQSPWQRGSNENTNGLLRQYFPHGTSLKGITQAELDAVARQLNERPRETLGFRTPAEQLARDVALTG
ncbi:MAG: IS30 family transposase [Gemmatimonadales bacterium]